MSDYEGMPGSLMDGMACGLIPICLKIPGIDELIIPDKTGILINNRKQAFLDAIKQLQNKPHFREELSNNAIYHIKENFSLAAAVDKWELFLTSFCNDAEGLERKEIVIPQKFNLPINTIAYEGGTRKEKTPAYTLKKNLLYIKKKKKY